MENQGTLLANLLNTADSYINGYKQNRFDESILQQTIFSEAAKSTVAESKNTTVSEVTVSETPKKISSLQTINDKIIKCTRCPLARTRTNVITGQGVENPLVLVIGEWPSYEDDIQGIPFAQNNGILLDKMLKAINLDKNTNCYLTYLTKCRPPQNREPSYDEQHSCLSFLEIQISLLKPKIILCMGRTPSQVLLKNELPIAQLRTQSYEYNGIPLFVTYPPSSLLKNNELKKPAWEDLKLLKIKLDQLTKAEN